MRTVSYRIGDLNKAVIHIGKVAENEHTRVQIDAGEIFAEYPNAAASLAVQPPEGQAYPVNVTRDGDLVLWDVKDSDLAAEGHGEIQLTFTEGSVVVKSTICRISVCRSIVGDGEAPTPIEDWIEEAQGVLNDLEAFDNITATAETLAPGSSATAEIRMVSDHKDILIGVPKGDKGDKGDPGDAGISLFNVDEDMELIMYWNEAKTVPDFEINDDMELEVVIV